MKNKLVLIDGNSILNRAFYGVPDLTNSQGKHTNAVYGFLNIMFKILEEEEADYLTVAFDVKEPTFRHKMYEAYKGTRKPMPEELREQVPIIKEILRAMNIAILEKPGYEADDILGTLALLGEQKNFLVSLVSGDRDLLQMASEKIKIRIPKTKQGKTEVEDYNEKEVLEKYGLSPAQIIDLKGLMGDASDNIPGVPGIGEKTAVKILTAFHSIENAYEHIEEITPNRAKGNLRENYELAQLSKRLATIKTDCELDYQIEDGKIDHIFNQKGFQLIKELEFKSLYSKFDSVESGDKKVEDCFAFLHSKKEAKEEIEAVISLTESFLAGKEEFLLGFQVFQKSEEEKKNPKNKDGQFTFGLNTEEGEEIYGISFAYHGKEQKSVYIPVSKEISGAWLKENCKKLLEKKVSFAFIDVKSQISFLDAEETMDLFDCSIGAYLINPLKASYYYDDIARDFLSLSVPSYQEYFNKKSLGEVKEEKDFPKFACYIAYIAYEAKRVLLGQLKEAGMETLFYEIEMPLIYTLYQMEQRGIRVNRAALKEYGDRLGVRIVELEKEIYELSGEKFNINSPKQLGVILFEKLKLPNGKKTKTGYSTAADILERLEKEHPIIEKILEYRQITKLKSTYADGLDHYIEQDGRIHTKFNQTITATGRLSSTEPNLQNIPIRMELGREIRKVFIPKEGCTFLDADYSQIELRLLAHMSKDERLIQAYQEEQDIHKITASQVFHIPLDQVTSEQRSNAKAVNFGIVYGISSFGLGQGLNITRKEAEEYIEKYFETYPRVKEFLEELVDFGKKNGYVVSLFQRKRPILELSSSNFSQRSFGERIAMNSPIQGTAADIMKIAMIRVNRRLKEETLHSYLILQIHDELLVETDKNEIEKVKTILSEEMYHAAELSVPLEITICQGDDWYDSK